MVPSGYYKVDKGGFRFLARNATYYVSIDGAVYFRTPYNWYRSCSSREDLRIGANEGRIRRIKDEKVEEYLRVHSIPPFSPELVAPEIIPHNIIS